MAIQIILTIYFSHKIIKIVFQKGGYPVLSDVSKETRDSYPDYHLFDNIVKKFLDKIIPQNNYTKSISPIMVASPTKANPTITSPFLLPNELLSFLPQSPKQR